VPTWAVRYFRSELPPREDWEADLSLMASSGLRCVVVPARWADCEPSEGAFALEHLIELASAARRNNLGLIVGVELSCVPAWLAARHDEALFEAASGRKVRPRLSPDAPGWPGLCLDSGAVRAQAGRFLRALGQTLGGKPGLVAYDLSGYSALGQLLAAHPGHRYCQCPASRARFVSWLRRTYGDDLEAFCSHCGLRFSDWSRVVPPRRPGRFPLAMLWERFLRENAAAQLRWCVEALREADPAAHVVAASEASPCRIPDIAAVASEVSDPACRVSGAPVLFADDWCRRQARGKRLWVVGASVRDERSVRRAAWGALAATTPRVVFECWRPDRWAGSEEPALVGHDGEPTRRLLHVGWFLGLLEAHPELAEATPLPPEAAVLVVPESARYWSAAGKPEIYERALRGAWLALVSRGAHVAFTRPEDLEGLPLLYVPLAPAVSAESAAALRNYLEAGGRVVAESPFARYDPLARAGDECPGFGLSEVFGATASEPPREVADPAPTFTGRGGSFPACLLWQPLLATEGSAKARFSGGGAAIVDNAWGRGAARLLATSPASGLGGPDWKRHSRVILDSLAFARVRLRVRVSSPGIMVRLLAGRQGQLFLCGFNPQETTQEATIRLSRSLGHFRRGHDLPSGKWRRLRDNARRFKLGPCEGFVLCLEAGPPPRRWRRLSRSQR